MNLERWILVYLATGPSFTRWAVLAFYGGGLVVLVAVILAAVVIAASTVFGLFGCANLTQSSHLPSVEQAFRIVRSM
jgi:hypothetical protein